MEDTPTGVPMICLQILEFSRLIQNREVSTLCSAAGFCPQQYKKIYLPDKAPPSLLFSCLGILHPSLSQKVLQSQMCCDYEYMDWPIFKLLVC